jgi:hypothetical protein
MITLVCEQCYFVFGCIATYRRPEDKVKICLSCLMKKCENREVFFSKIDKRSDFEVRGFCPNCLKPGGEI